MRIGLLTIHRANSYGGVLQAFATQRILAKHGEVSIINYQPPCLERTMRLLRVGLDTRMPLRVAKDVLQLRSRRALLAKFEDFIDNCLNTTVPIKSESDLYGMGDVYDVFVSGSDQIWNPHITCGLDKNYLLAFAGDKPRVSFSSSAGSYVFRPDEIFMLVAHLSNYRAVSVREEDTAVMLRNSGLRKPVAVTLDPTLLLNAEEWRNAIDGPGDHLMIRQQYMLAYLLKTGRNEKKIIKKVAGITKLPVLALDQQPYAGFMCECHIHDASPSEFLRFVEMSSFVVTNSFHGVAFSIIFRKPFLVIPPAQGMNRIATLLSKVGLMNRVAAPGVDIEQQARSIIDYDDVDRRLRGLQEEACNFLEYALRRLT